MAKNRITLKECSVVFNPNDHTYYLPEKDKYLSGITGMLQRQLFPDTYACVPKPILEQSAEYGTNVHRSLELFDMEWANDGSQEVSDYIKLCTDNDLVHETSEYLITDNENYASMIDKVYRVDDTTFDIGDIKTYGVMTSEKSEMARWQLSIYAYLFEMMNKNAKIRRIFILHIRYKAQKDGNVDHISEFIELKRIPSAIIKELLDQDSSGYQFSNPFAIPEDVKSQEDLIRHLVQTKTEAENQLSYIKANILSLMEAQDIKSWCTETMRITRKLPTSRTAFSLADFKKAHSEIDLEPFMKTTHVSGSIIITL